jgi:hypothetical protein
VTPVNWGDFVDQVSIFQVAVWVVIAIMLFLLLRKFWPLISNTVAVVNALLALPAFIAAQGLFRDEVKAELAAQTETILEIHHEVNYNNGSSVKDAIARLEKQAGTKPPARRVTKPKATP